MGVPETNPAFSQNNKLKTNITSQGKLQRLELLADLNNVEEMVHIPIHNLI